MKYGFDDAWVKSGKGREKKKNGYTFNSWKPSKRIDYILYRGGRSLSARVAGTEPASFPDIKPVGGVEKMRGKLFPSDHFFLTSDIELPPVPERKEKTKENEKQGDEGSVPSHEDL